MNLIPIKVPMRVSVSDTTIPMGVATSNVPIGMEIGAEYSVVPTEEYTGEYEFTPSEDTQTITIEGKTASQDIVIQPIPSNYGLITWDGRTLTVS